MTAIGAPIERDIVRISGQDTISWLQGQLSQDVDQLAVATSTWTLLLQPQGKVDAWMRITKTATDTVVLDTDAGFGDTVVTRLTRFKLRTKADIEQLDWPAIAVRGDAPRPALPDDVLRLPLTRRHGPGYDLIGPGAAIPTDVREVDPDEIERVRIARGVPAMGAELTADTIPAEAGAWFIDESVSFTKGCYVGQELTARIDARGGNVPRHVRILVAEAPLAVGTRVSVDSADVGVVTSATDSGLGLATLGRAVSVGDTVTVGSTAAVVHDEPVPAPS